MRLRLEDHGEGWFWKSPSVEVEVLDQLREHSRPFYRVVFADPAEVLQGGEPVERREGTEQADLPAGQGDGESSVAACSAAWLSPRWVGHEVGRDHDIIALLWLTEDIDRAAKPPRDVDYSARVVCREID